MLMEFCVFYLFSLISVQSSALWSSLILVPTSMLLVMNVVNTSNSITVFVFIMVFVGGLMLLLVSMTSISFQDQSMSISFIILAVLISIVFLSETKPIYEVLFLSSMSWLDVMGIESLFLILLLLTLGLMVVTNMLLFFKGLARGM